MAFHFDFEAIKKHPYAIGGAIIVGGLIIFYLLSRGGGGGSSSSASTADSWAAEALQYDEQEAQINASLQASNNQNQAQLAQDQLEAQVSNTQTAASLSAQNTSTEANLAADIAGVVGSIYNTNAQTASNANDLVYAENIQDMQDGVLEDQINSGVTENANNNATALGATLAGDSLEQTLGLTSLSDATTLATAQQQQYQNEVNQIIPLAGQQKNSALDATDQTNLFETILSGGNPSVAEAGDSGTSTAVVSGNNTSVAKVGSITSGLTSLINGLL